MILVTGVNGRLGSLILHHLISREAEVVGGSRTPKASERYVDFDSPHALDLHDIDTLVLISAGYAEDDVVVARHKRVLKTARDQGVQHVIYTTLIGAGDHMTFALPHRVTEQTVMESGINWTILRNGLYAELIGELLNHHNGMIQSPFGTGSIAAPRRDDLAQAAAIVAMSPTQHRHMTYELTAPAFSVNDIARVLGTPIHRLTLEAYRNQLLSTPGLLPFQPPMLISIATSIRHRLLAQDHPDLAHLLGRSPKAGLPVAADVLATKAAYSQEY